MKNFDALRLHNLLALLQQQQTLAFQTGATSPFGDAPASFSFKAAYNVGLLKPHVEVILAALKGPWDDVINAFAPEEAKLALRHSGLPEDTPVTPDQQYAVKDPVAFEADQKALRAQFPGLLDALQDRELAQGQVFQQESPTIVLWKAKLDEFPSKLTMEHSAILLPMVEGPPIG